jgi:hypothetical protein
MLPSWGWSQEIFIVETRPMFSRSLETHGWSPRLPNNCAAWSAIMLKDAQLGVDNQA